MENVLSVLIHAIGREKSRLGKIQVRFVNLIIFIILLVTTVLLLLQVNAKNFQMTVIVGASLLVYLVILYMATEALQRRRAEMRRRLYRHWRFTYQLDAFSDTRIDSSVVIGIRWQWLKPEAVRVETHGDLQYNAVGRIRAIVGDLQQTFRTKEPWILDLDNLRQGILYAYPVAVNSFASKLFSTEVTIFEIVKNVIDARGLPQITFEGLANMNGEVYFDHVILSNLEAQHFTDYTIDYARRAFLDNFIERDDQHVWDVVARGDGTVAFMQVPIGSTGPFN